MYCFTNGKKMQFLYFLLKYILEPVLYFYLSKEIQSVLVLNYRT